MPTLATHLVSLSPPGTRSSAKGVTCVGEGTVSETGWSLPDTECVPCDVATPEPCPDDHTRAVVSVDCSTMNCTANADPSHGVFPFSHAVISEDSMWMSQPESTLWINLVHPFSNTSVMELVSTPATRDLVSVWDPSKGQLKVYSASGSATVVEFQAFFVAAVTV